MSVLEDLELLGTSSRERIASASSLSELEEARVAIMGKKGSLTAVLRSMGSLSPEERPAVGKRVNELRSQIEGLIKEQKASLSEQALAEQIAREKIDITLPGTRLSPGTQHLIAQIVEEIEDLFCSMGYEVRDGSYVETCYYNFTALNAPEDHPSRSARDTFYLYDRDPQGKPGRVAGESNLLLRTQTSGVQVHTMEEQKPPIYMIAPGTVFRPDTADACHLPQFTQVEGLVVDEGISFADLKGTLDHFTREIFGKDKKTRYRPHFFPFTEPSCEVDVSCGVCKGAGCRFCKNSGWLEILGCGMVDPNVFAHCGIDAAKYSGFAFGIGAERVAALRYDLPDLRMLVSGDLRFLGQFA